MHSLPIFLRLQGRPVILIGSGEAADAKRRLLERAGARIVDEDGEARLAIVATDDETAVARLKVRGVLVNVVDRPDLCDFTLPAIVDRDPVIVAVGTGGASAGLAAALRQRLEVLLPSSLGQLALDLREARVALREDYPDGADRRRALAAALAPGGELDPLAPNPDVAAWLLADGVRGAPVGITKYIVLRTTDPDDLTLREARTLASADQIYHTAAVPRSVLDRARADAMRIAGPAPAAGEPGLTVVVAMA